MVWLDSTKAPYKVHIHYSIISKRLFYFTLMLYLWAQRFKFASTPVKESIFRVATHAKIILSLMRHLMQISFLLSPTKIWSKYTNHWILSEIQLFLVLIYIFSNSHIISNFLNCFTWLVWAFFFYFLVKFHARFDLRYSYEIVLSIKIIEDRECQHASM